MGFFDLRLTNRKLLLRFKRHFGRSTDYGSIKANKDLDDKQWHKVKIQRNKKEMILTIDDYKIRKKAPVNDLHFGSLERNNFVFLGGMPATYKNKENRHKLTLPSIMFGLGWRGQMRNLQYSNCSCPLRSAKIMKLSGARRDNLCETNNPCDKNNPNCDCLIDSLGKPKCDCTDKSCDENACESTSLMKVGSSDQFGCYKWEKGSQCWRTSYDYTKRCYIPNEMCTVSQHNHATCVKETEEKCSSEGWCYANGDGIAGYCRYDDSCLEATTKPCTDLARL